MKPIHHDAYEVFHQQWALVSAGKPDHFNTMTIGWGGVGCLWNRPVATVYVRPSRYTYAFLEANEYFTVSFFSQEYRDALKILGSRSGRDCDKVGLSGLTPVAAGDSVTFAQAQYTLLCRKIYCHDLQAEQIPEEFFNRFYEPGESPHRVYYGEIIEVIQS